MSEKLHSFDGADPVGVIGAMRQTPSLVLQLSCQDLDRVLEAGHLPYLVVVDQPTASETIVMNGTG
jgi:hypothetical protein